MSQHTDEAAFTALHSRDRLADDGTPALSSRFVRYLDGDLGATRHGTPPLPLSLDEARARLAQDYPELAAAVDLCCVQGRTLRAAAGVLHVCHRCQGRFIFDPLTPTKVDPSGLCIDPSGRYHMLR